MLIQVYIVDLAVLYFAFYVHRVEVASAKREDKVESSLIEVSV